MSDSIYLSLCCAVLHELLGLATITAAMAFPVAESGFGVYGRPGQAAAFPCSFQTHLVDGSPFLYEVVAQIAHDSIPLGPLQ